jgi:hypothetical protein
MSTVAWVNPVDLDTLIIVCPAGDAQTMMDVTVRDQFNLPVANQNVTASFVDARVLEDPITGVTDVNGYVRLTIKAGLDNSAGRQPRVYSNWSVVCMGVTLKTASTYLVSPDMTQAVGSETLVESLDDAMFRNDYGFGLVGLQRSDLNGDSVVDPLDNAIFAIHWLDNN